MTSGPEQPRAYGFTVGHMAVIGICAAVLLFFLLLKNDFKVPRLFARGNEPATKVLTYEAAKQQVLARSGNGNASGAGDSEVIAQLAMVDPSVSGGEVLGASTDPLLPDADSLISKDKLEQISLSLGKPANPGSVASYLQHVRLAESQYDSLGMMAVMNSTDSAVLNDAAQAAVQLAETLRQITVPRGLEYYARIKIYYYYTLSQIGTSLAKGDNDPQLSQSSAEFLSLSQKIEQEQQRITQEYEASK